MLTTMVADGAAGGASVAEGWRVGVLGGLNGGLAPRLHPGFGGAKAKGARTAHSVSESGSQVRSGE